MTLGSVLARLNELPAKLLVAMTVTRSDDRTNPSTRDTAVPAAITAALRPRPPSVADASLTLIPSPRPATGTPAPPVRAHRDPRQPAGRPDGWSAHAGWSARHRTPAREPAGRRPRPCRCPPTPRGPAPGTACCRPAGLRPRCAARRSP